MYVIKDFMMINMSQVNHVIKCLSNSENIPFCILFMYSDRTSQVFYFENEYERDLAFLTIMQSLSQNLAICYLDSDTTKYLMENSKIIKPKPKKKKGVIC